MSKKHLAEIPFTNPIYSVGDVVHQVKYSDQKGEYIITKAHSHDPMMIHGLCTVWYTLRHLKSGITDSSWEIYLAPAEIMESPLWKALR